MKTIFIVSREMNGINLIECVFSTYNKAKNYLYKLNGFNASFDENDEIWKNEPLSGYVGISRYWIDIRDIDES